jgi:hypothetical protein
MIAAALLKAFFAFFKSLMRNAIPLDWWSAVDVHSASLGFWEQRNREWR